MPDNPPRPANPDVSLHGIAYNEDTDRLKAEVVSALSAKVAAGRLFFAGGKVTAALGQNGSIHLSNPADSGRLIVVLGWSLAADVSTEVEYLHEATSSGTIKAAFNANHGSAETAEAVIRAGANALTGGDVLSPIERVTASLKVDNKDRMIIIPPGHSFGIRAANPGAAMNIWANVEWYEDDITA